MAAANDTTTGSMSAQSAALQLNANQFGTTSEAIKAAQDAQDKAGTSTADTTTKMQLQNDAAGLLKMALDGLNGKAISAAQAQNAFDSQLTNMGTHVDKTGKQIKFTTTNIGDMSAASVALRGQLNGQVSALMQTVEANGGLDESTGKAKEQMESMRTQIINNAVAHGVDKDAVTAYVDNLLTIPKSVPPTKVDIDKAEAELKLKGFQSAINSLTGKTVTIYAQANIDAAMAALDTLHANSMVTANQYATGDAYQKSGGGEVGYKADGGNVAYLAAGGFPGGPRGTDTVPTWLTPEEFVVKRASAKSIGLPALNYMNQTGQLPPQPSGAAPNATPIYVQNPFTGEYLLAQVDGRVGAGIGAANRDAMQRPAR
jgi:soluble cytochrome b562